MTGEIVKNMLLGLERERVIKARSAELEPTGYTCCKGCGETLYYDPYGAHDYNDCWANLCDQKEGWSDSGERFLWELALKRKADAKKGTTQNFVV